MNSIKRILLQILITLFGGVIGMFLGAIYGGNFATDLVILGVRGYEATSQLGMILGLVLGCAVSIRILHK